MNFGKWIVVAFVLFTIFIGTLVAICVRQDISLVSKEYYKDELAYQAHITKISNTRSLDQRPSVRNIGNDQLEIAFAQSVDKGEIKVFCPSDPKMDRTIELNLSDNRQIVDVSTLKPGMYRVKMSWAAYGKEYFLEEVVYI